MTDFKDFQEAIVLSANDVIATVLLVNIDGDGTAPLEVVQVDLGDERNYRKVHGESKFQRGNQIRIRVKVSKCKEKWSEKEIQDLFKFFYDIDDEKSELWNRLNEESKKFDSEWRDLCKRDRERLLLPPKNMKGG